jgi:ribonuclease-3
MVEAVWEACMSSTDVQAVRKKSESARLCAPASLPLHLLQERLGYCFRDSAGLERALTHPSSTVDDDDNERMEFLGDAILSLCVGQMLYECYPDWSEGRLTEVKSVVVSTSCLARVAGRLQLRNFSRLGKGLPSGEPLPASVLANLFEALCAAIYLDGGLPAARVFVEQVLGDEIAGVTNGQEVNYKSSLQQVTQRRFGLTPNCAVHRITDPLAKPR